MKILFCGAHPDDAEIYMFGTLLAYRAMQADVVLVTACKGDGGSTDRSPDQPLEVTRRAEAEKGAAELGARLVMLGFADASLGEQRHDLFLRLERLFAEEKPDLIFTHSLNDYHADHRNLSAAVTLAASERLPLAYVDTMNGEGFLPTHYVDIKEYSARKLAAIRLHFSQKPRRYALGALALAQRRGHEATGLDGPQMEAFRYDGHRRARDLTRLLPGKVHVANVMSVAAPAGRVPQSGTYQVNFSQPGSPDIKPAKD